MTTSSSLKNSIKKIRHFLPAYQQVVSKLRKNATPILEGRKTCLFDFTSSHIDAVMARYLYHIVAEFKTLDYQLVFSNNYHFLATAKKKRYKSFCFEGAYSIVPPKSKNRYDVVITDRPSHQYEANEKVITINYNNRRSTNEQEIELPFFVHPKTQKNGTILAYDFSTTTKREMKLFFSGNSGTPNYDNKDLNKQHKVLTRNQVLESITTNFSDQVLIPENNEEFFNNLESKPIVLAGNEVRIPNNQWIETIGKADFFIAPPGAHMPLCHNLIEALAAGTIPILQYSNYVTPALENLENCLIYTDEESLSNQLNYAISLSQNEVIRLRTNAKNYYQQYCQPGSFGKKLIAHPEKIITLLLNAYRTPLPSPNALQD